MEIVRLVLGLIALAGLVTLAAGLAGFHLQDGELGSRYRRANVTVESMEWPRVVLRRADAKRWELKRFVPLPWWNVGETIPIHVSEDESRVVPVFGGYHPLLLMLYGFLAVMFGVGVRAFVPEPPLNVPLTPAWPVVLHEEQARAWVFLLLGIGLVGWVVKDWMMPEEGAPRFAIGADVTRLAMAGMLTLGGVVWLSKKIRVTPEELVETSAVGEKRVRFADVKFANKVVVRSDDSKKSLLGVKLVLSDAKGNSLYEFTSSLEPVEQDEAVRNYLMKRFPAREQ
ncbi:MAG: hypothetical protein SFV54_01550 [Bryobacteraceae bacterium]|nr:hypothetical protein [Bryobacteraceae bacterium]